MYDIDFKILEKEYSWYANLIIQASYNNIWFAELITQPLNVDATLFHNHDFISPSNRKHLENTKSIYHYSIPTVKLFYPEPFIAAASFMHNDIWFIHILIYQYWLWFVFIFIIVFFLITFLCIVRWCNMRTKPRRETRGVSRSKCGDLITAIVPVSWAASIIISESTDAIDYFDGFGTTEMVVGIRAYQWGWEYYYPKDIDLNYNIRKSYSSNFGKSLKYAHSDYNNLHANKMWKFYQNKLYDNVISASHVLLVPSDNNKLLNYVNFSDIGTNAFHESSLFKHTRMFSKIFNSHLVNSTSQFANLYSKLSSVFGSDGELTDSHFYGLKRQQNMLSSNAITNNFSTFFNTKNVSKMLNYNHKFNKNAYTSTGLQQIYFFKTNAERILKTSWFLYANYSNMIFYDFETNFNKHLIFSNYNELLNDDDDKKKIKRVINKLLINLSTNHNLISKKMFSQFNFSHHLNSTLISSNHIFNNIRFSKKYITSFSANKTIPKSLTSNKQNAALSIRNANYNLNNKINSSTFFLNKITSNIPYNISQFNNTYKIRWIDTQNLYKLTNNKNYFEPTTPIFLTNKNTISLNNFDQFIDKEENTAILSAQTKEELTNEPILRAYWNTSFAHTDVTWRFQNVKNSNVMHNLFYLPFFTFGQDYDFLNWQGLKMLEDAFWEGFNSIYTIEEYTECNENYNEFLYVNKLNRDYFFKFKEVFPYNDILSKPTFSDLKIHDSSTTPSIYVDDSLFAPSLLATYKFVNLFEPNNLIYLEDSYEFIKTLSSCFDMSHNNNFLFSLVTNNVHNSNFVFTNYRATAEDFTLFATPFKNFEANFFLIYAKSLINLSNNINLVDLVDFTFSKNSQNIQNIFLYSYFSKFDFNFTHSFRLENLLNNRSTNRNITSIFNSYQKVYKPRFDENRSHGKITDVANLFIKQPILAAPKAKIERVLGKNKTTFFTHFNYKNENLPIFNGLYDALISVNYYIFDYPFLAALKSDVTRFIWTDWYSRWGMTEVQPASASKYSITGMPNFNKNIEWPGDINNEFYDSEAYFLRLARARKNYLPSWAHIPYHYTMNTQYYNDSYFNIEPLLKKKKIRKLKNFLYNSNVFWNSINNFNNTQILFVPTHSNIFTFSRSSWTNNNFYASYFNTISNLHDINTKREYLFREYLASKNNIFQLSNYMINKPNKGLIKDIRAIFASSSKTLLNSEYTRESYYRSLKFFKHESLTPNFITIFNNLGISTNLLYFLLHETDNKPTNFDALTSKMQKSQYRPMRRGISNMIRLHGTNAVAMPIEIRLQVLASSKDVIHSWAIPSAGVKIDCVPGYSSHRVIIFLVSGIFWGQCMEICGRYHHWMPIIVYFMKRDLFFLWCTHFVFLSGANNMWVMNDRQFTQYGKPITYDKLSWINEFK